MRRVRKKIGPLLYIARSWTDVNLFIYLQRYFQELHIAEIQLGVKPDQPRSYGTTSRTSVEGCRREVFWGKIRKEENPAQHINGPQSSLKLEQATVMGTGNESVPIQLAQCRFPRLAISNAEMLIRFSNKTPGSNFIKQHLETVVV